MRVFLSTLLVCVLLAVTPALAGSVTYTDMRGKWQPTGCNVPVTPAEMVRNSEAAANDLNAQIAARNAFMAEAQTYMDCLSKEASRDAEAVSFMITKSAQAMIDKVMAETSPVSSAKDAIKQ